MVDLDNTGESFLVENDDEATRMWKFGLGIWKLPGVRETCLDWQARFGFDASFLVFLSWVGCARRESIGVERVHDANAEVSEWRQRTIEPARTARKYVRGNGARENPEATAVFELLRAVELRAELHEQSVLLRWWRAQEKDTAGEGGFTASVAAYLSTLGPPEDEGLEDELRRICDLIANIEI
jgi:uncharacterized protein (TIGR02444 family)